jgi:phosphate transport system substrate-binding protein
METAPRYVFLGFVVLVGGALVAIVLHQRNMTPPEPPIQGAGSTFVYPLMVQWSSQYEHTESGCRIGYRSLGSGTGIKYFMDKKVDFACSDAPMTDEQLAKIRQAGSEAVHIPLVLGAVVPVYNLPGVKAPLQFTGAVLADIYLGKIKKWNDKALSDLNTAVELPDKAIVVVHRADGSGTTYIWTDYLSKVSAAWKKTVGVGAEVKWPVGHGEPGNEGVAEKVQKTSGSIGYVELTYAYRLDLAYGLVQNRAKEFVKANLASVTKAAESGLVEIPDDLRYSLTDAAGKDSYPIVGTTWAIVRTRQPREKGHKLVDFLGWAVGKGQDQVQGLLYARLPEALVARAEKKIEDIKIDE